jgi:hypothetical protein
MAEKEGGVVAKGHEEGLKMAISLLEEFVLVGDLKKLLKRSHGPFNYTKYPCKNTPKDSFFFLSFMGLKALFYYT